MTIKGFGLRNGIILLVFTCGVYLGSYRIGYILDFGDFGLDVGMNLVYLLRGLALAIYVALLLLCLYWII